MIVTKKEQTRLIGLIADSMNEYNVILSHIDDTTSAKALAHILDYLGLILSYLNNAEIKENNIGDLFK